LSTGTTTLQEKADMNATFGLSRLGQLSMNAKDLDRATTFYRDVLGARFLFDVPKMSFFDLEGIRLMLAVAEGSEHDHPGSVLYFSVDDLEEAHGIMVQRGVKFETPPHLVADMDDHELWMAFFRDSEENLLALMSEKPKP
jgi:predicted enzyme related to lactoylglutathione lyase